MSGQFHAHCKSSLGRGLVGAAFGSGTFWSLVRAQLVQFVVAQRRGRAGARQPRQPRRQWRAGASRGEQGSEQCGAPDFFDGLGQWACQEAAGGEKLVETPAPAQEVGVSRRRPLARAPCLRGSEFFSQVKVDEAPWDSKVKLVFSRIPYTSMCVCVTALATVCC